MCVIRAGGRVQNAIDAGKTVLHDAQDAGAPLLITGGPDQGKALDLAILQPRFGVRDHRCVLPDKGKAVIAALARPVLRHDLQRLHDVV